MKVGFLTTWKQRKSIAVYAAGLAEALLDLGHQVVVWDTAEGRGDCLTGPTSCVHAAEAVAALKECDVLHLQSEDFTQPEWNNVYEALRKLQHVPLVQTLHSNCNPYLPQVKFFFAHHPDLMEKWCIDREAVIVPMPAPKIDYVPPTEREYHLISFQNNGRVQERELQEAVDRVNIRSKKPFVLRLRNFDKEGWLSNEEYTSLLQQANLFTPTYCTSGGAAVRSATYAWMAAVGRLIIASDTEWFEHIESKALMRVDPNNVKQIVNCLLRFDKHGDFFQKNAKEEADRVRKEETWTALAPKIYVPTYQEAIAGKKR